MKGLLSLILTLLYVANFAAQPSSGGQDIFTITSTPECEASENGKIIILVDLIAKGNYEFPFEYYITNKSTNETSNGLINSSNTNIDGLKADNYEILIYVSSSCYSKTSIVVGEALNPLDLIFQTVDVSNCHMGSCKAVVQGDIPSNLSYFWSNDSTTNTISNLIVSNYCVTVTNPLGCRVIDCADVEDQFINFKVESFKNETLCADESGDGEIIISNDKSNANCSFEWTGPNGFFATSQSLLNFDNSIVMHKGTYTLTITYPEGCTAKITKNLCCCKTYEFNSDGKCEPVGSPFLVRFKSIIF